MILLDTHVLIWLAKDPSKLSKTAADAIRRAGGSGGLSISAISLWELAWLTKSGRIAFSGTAEDFIGKISSRTSIVPISLNIAVLASQFPATYSKDPSDRLIGATAMSEGIALITKDRSIRNFKQIETIW